MSHAAAEQRTSSMARAAWVRTASFARVHRGTAAWLAAALAVYGLESLAWPVRGGRDSTTYLMYYRDMWNAHPALPELMLFRTPVAPLLVGIPLQLGGAAFLEVVFGVAYAISVAAYVRAAATFSRTCAIFVGAALLLYPPYGALFHQAGSDSAFAFVLALWTLGIVRTARNPTLWKYALLGVGFLAVVLARPSGQVFLLFALVPLVLPGSWSARLARAGSFLIVAIALLTAWAGYNSFRYGDFTVSRTGSADVPFFRVFVMERTISPSNGPASRELTAAVRRDLLPRYRQHFDVQTFFSAASERMWGDLVVLSDRVWGWDSDYSILRRVAFEAIRRHPALYVRDVADATRFELTSSYSFAPSLPRQSAPPMSPKQRAAAARADAKADPGGILWWLATTPDRSIRSGPHGWIWRDPGAKMHSERVNAEVRAMESDLPDRKGSSRVAAALNDVSRIYPRMALLLLVGVLALLVRRPQNWILPASLAALGLALLVFTMAGMPPGLEYRLPLDPLFILFAAAALTLPGRPWIRASWPRRPHARP